MRIRVLLTKKGYQISDVEGYSAAKVKNGFRHRWKAWSRKRSELIAAANVNVVNSLRKNPNIPLNSFLDVWMWGAGFRRIRFLCRATAIDHPTDTRIKVSATTARVSRAGGFFQSGPSQCTR